MHGKAQEVRLVAVSVPLEGNHALNAVRLEDVDVRVVPIFFESFDETHFHRFDVLDQVQRVNDFEQFLCAVLLHFSLQTVLRKDLTVLVSEIEDRAVVGHDVSVAV